MGQAHGPQRGDLGDVSGCGGKLPCDSFWGVEGALMLLHHIVSLV